MKLYVIGVLQILEDVEEESPAQAKDISKGLGTWGPGSVLSHKGLPSFSHVDEELSGAVDGKGSQPHTSSTLLDVVLPAWP